MVKRKIVLDMILNIVATAIPTIVLQLLILPALAWDMPDEKYGLLVTILAFLNVVPSTMGNVLNNIRLLYNNKYIEKKYEGDFNIILLLLMGINIIVVGVFSYSYENTLTIFSLLMTLFVSVVWLAKEYFIVAFRLKIDYVAIMINNLLQVAGYCLGYVIYRFIGQWQFIYLTGYIVSLVYIFMHCSIWREKFRITPLFKDTTWQSALLLASNLLNRVITYADKILIYPILGGEVVSVYYAATIFGKIVSLIITPVNSVVLTYLSKLKKKQDTMFKTAFLIGICVCFIGYVCCIAISRPVLGIIYPQYVNDAMQYIYITTGTTVLYALISIVNPFILKYFPMKWQIAINGGTALFYVALCMTLLHFFGLYGFCIGALMTNLFKLIFMLFIYLKCKALSN